MSTKDEELLKAQFFFTYVEKLDMLIQKSNDRLYTKVKDTITIIVSLMALIIGAGNFILLNSYDTKLLIPFGISLLLFCVSAFKGGQILWNIEFYSQDPLYMIQTYAKESPSVVVMKTASTWADSVNENREFFNNKDKVWKSMELYLGLGLAVLVFTFLVQFILAIDC